VVDLERLSVVMPTFQRPIYALRNMRLLDQTGARVHVLDGSAEPIDPRLRAGLSGRINYVHLPGSYEERLARAADLIDTPFCVTVGDDDMHLPSGLEASVSALDADPELVAATGTALAFLSTDTEVAGRLIYPELHGRAILADDPIERMVDHLGRYLPSASYAVTRTPVWKRAMRALTGKRFAPFRLGELQYEMTIVYAGKIVVVPHLMWLRSLENPSLWKADEVPLKGWWLASDDREEFAAYMGQALTDDPLEQDAAAQGSLDAMDTYIQGLRDRVALRRRLTPAEQLERWPVHPELPLTEWARRVAQDDVVVNEADLATAIAAVEATPADVVQDLPAAWTGR